MSNSSLFDQLYKKLKNVIPVAEIRYKAELAEEINRLKKERNAVILGHNYMEPASTIRSRITAGIPSN